MNRMLSFRCAGFVTVSSLVLVAGLAFGGCSSGPDPELLDCQGREDALKGSLVECQQAVDECQQAVDVARQAGEAVRAEMAAANEQKVALQTRIDTMEKEIAELKQTPSAVSQEILAAADDADTVEKIDSVMERISAFSERFPDASQKRVLSRRTAALKKARAKMVREAEKARAMAAISEVRNLLSGVSDGGDLSVVEMVSVANHLAGKDLKYEAISGMPKTSYGEAMKDSDSERGKAMVVSGSIIQITKEGNFYTGLICSGDYCNRIYHFVTMGTTRGLNERSFGRFAGVFAQRYSYSNAGGGTTHSLALVGYFKGQD